MNNRSNVYIFLTKIFKELDTHLNPYIQRKKALPKIFGQYFIARQPSRQHPKSSPKMIDTPPQTAEIKKDAIK